MDGTAESKVRPQKIKSVSHKIDIVLCAVLLPMVFLSVSLFIKTILYRDVPPSLLGHISLIMKSEEMSPTICSGDLIIIRNRSAVSEIYTGGTIVCFKNGSKYKVGRIINSITEEDGQTQYLLRNDYDETSEETVDDVQVIGEYKWSVTGLGKLIFLAQTQTGLLLFVVLPVILIFAAITLIQRKRIRDADVS